MSKKKVTMVEFRKTIATSLGTAFGIVIGMIWTNVVLGAFATAGISLTTAEGDMVPVVLLRNSCHHSYNNIRNRYSLHREMGRKRVRDTLRNCMKQQKESLPLLLARNMTM